MARLRILAVDDSDEIRTTLAAAIQKLGHIAEVADSAETALELFDSARFDVVIADLYLPGMNGDILARVIKRQDGQIPVILLTAYPPAQVPEDVDALLLKPFTIESLSSSLKQARVASFAQG